MVLLRFVSPQHTSISRARRYSRMYMIYACMYAALPCWTQGEARRDLLKRIQQKNPREQRLLGIYSLDEANKPFPRKMAYLTHDRLAAYWWSARKSSHQRRYTRRPQPFGTQDRMELARYAGKMTQWRVLSYSSALPFEPSQTSSKNETVQEVIDRTPPGWTLQGI